MGQLKKHHVRRLPMTAAEIQSAIDKSISQYSWARNHYEQQHEVMQFMKEHITQLLAIQINKARENA